MSQKEDKTKTLFDNIEKAGNLVKEISSTQNNISDFLKDKGVRTKVSVKK